MIEVKVVDDELLVKGSLDLGIAGTYVNEEFSSDIISILVPFSEIVEEYEEGRYYWDFMKEYLAGKEFTEENVAKAISDYYNNLEKKVQDCIMQINSNLLVNVFEHMIDCSMEFWKIEGAYIKEKMPLCDEEEYEEVIYGANRDAMSALFDEYYDTPNDNSMEKTDAETRLREMFPMFNMDGLIAGIRPEGLTLEGDSFSFQCSDSWKRQIMCAAYDRLDERFCFTDWHNF